MTFGVFVIDNSIFYVKKFIDNSRIFRSAAFSGRARVRQLCGKKEILEGGDDVEKHGKGKTRDEESGRKVGGDAGLGEESLRKRRRKRNGERKGGVWRKSAGGKAGDAGPGGYGTGMRRERGTKGGAGAGMGCVGTGGGGARGRKRGGGSGCASGMFGERREKRKESCGCGEEKKRISL